MLASPPLLARSAASRPAATPLSAPHSGSSWLPSSSSTSRACPRNSSTTCGQGTETGRTWAACCSAQERCAQLVGQRQARQPGGGVARQWRQGGAAHLWRRALALLGHHLPHHLPQAGGGALRGQRAAQAE